MPQPIVIFKWMCERLYLGRVIINSRNCELYCEFMQRFGLEPCDESEREYEQALKGLLFAGHLQVIDKRQSQPTIYKSLYEPQH